MSKIKTIQLNNYKFFGKSEPIEIGSKHVLLYGENGSGKSSLYSALLLLLKSSSMDYKNIKELFSKTHDDSLVNLYAPVSNPATGETDAFVEIVLDDDAQTKYRISSDDEHITNMQSSNRQESHLASDFIDYKFIFKTHLFSEKEIDLFEVVEKEILCYSPFSNHRPLFLR